MIIAVDFFAEYLPDFAIFNVNVHDPPVPIVNFVGLLFGVNVHEPVFDQVFTPGEFDEATRAKNFSWPAVKEYTYQFICVFVAAATEPAVTPPNKAVTATITPTSKIALDRISEPCNHLRPGHDPC